MAPFAATDRIQLPEVTLCAVTSVNVQATIAALEASMAAMDFAECLLFTDAKVRPANRAIQVIPILNLPSAEAYSRFVLRQLADFVLTSHCLVVQWDGHVANPASWDPAFLEYDYIGASWPQFSDGHDVGNGGFSLRSRQLLNTFQDKEFRPSHPEDVLIGRTYRTRLEALGLRFAPREVADRFSAERAGDPATAFGYHGVWHMPEVLGVERFWEIYRSLDDRNTIRHDFGPLLRQVGQGPNGPGRACSMVVHRLVDVVTKGA
mgnify:CR=1 FL=1